MTTYQVFWAFPTQEASVKCTEAFVEYLTEGKQADKFDGFEIKCRVMDPQNGTGNFVVKADGPQKIWEHTAPWIKDFGVKVEVRVMLTDEEFVQTAKKTGLASQLKNRYVAEIFIFLKKILYYLDFRSLISLLTSNPNTIKHIQ